MTNRDPMRFRKSEVRKRSEVRAAKIRKRPRPTTARQLAYEILEEFRLTGTFVSQLLEERLEGQHRVWLANPPLAARVGTGRDDAGLSVLAVSSAPAEQPVPVPVEPAVVEPSETASVWAAAAARRRGATSEPAPEPVATPVPTPAPGSLPAAYSAPVRDSKSDQEISRLDRRLVTELANGVVRRQVTLDRILREFITRDSGAVEPELWTLLRLGVYQLVMMDGIPAHAAVHETVQLAHWVEQPRWTGFLNGVLRSISREVTDEFISRAASNAVPVAVRIEGRELQIDGRSQNADGPEQDIEEADGEKADSREADGEKAVSGDTETVTGTGTGSRFGCFRRIKRRVFASPVAAPAQYIADAFGLPFWLVNRWESRFTFDELVELGHWFDQRQPLTLRVNPLKTTRDQLLNDFSRALGDSVPDCFGPGDRPESIRYDGSLRIVDLPGFKVGAFTVQDETAMAAAALLAPQPGQAILDLCAAPGTKTTHLAELMKNEGQIIAADVDSKRLLRVEENAERLGLSIITPLRIPDDLSELPQTEFDGILADVPCSNTGVLGKRAEVRTRLQSEEIAELSALQQRILNAAAEKLKPGGRLVYSTCSIEPEENAGTLNGFLEKHSNFELLETHEYLPGRPSDGGFQALLRRVT